MQIRRDIEALRAISVFGIVWFHAAIAGHETAQEIAYGGLIGFLILSIYLAGRPAPNLAASVRKRAARLLVPWLLWSGIYGIAKIALGKPAFDFSNGVVAGLLIGPSLHLWYLPYIFAALLAVDRLRACFAARQLALGGALAAIATLALVPWWRDLSLGLGYPWAQHFHAAPGLMLGLFFLHHDALPARTVGVLTLAALAVALLRLPYVGVGMPYAVGIVAGYLIARRSWIDHTPALLARIGGHAFGIYLIHIFVLHAMALQTLVQGMLLPVAAFALSLGAVVAIKRAFPGTARLIC